MTAAEAAGALKAWLLEDRGKAVRLSGSMLEKYENAKNPAPSHIVEAALAVYDKTRERDRLTNVYQKEDAGEEGGAGTSPYAWIAGSFFIGGGCKPWSVNRNGMGTTQIRAFQQGKPSVQLTAKAMGNLPGKCLIAFETDEYPHEDTWLLVSNKRNPDQMAVRFVSSARPSVLMGLDDDGEWPLGDWNILGWAVSWAPWQIDSPGEWHTPRGGIGPGYLPK